VKKGGRERKGGKERKKKEGKEGRKKRRTGKGESKPGVLVHTCNLWRLRQDCQFKASLGYRPKPCLKKVRREG
jgi:hypothetical protein